MSKLKDLTGQKFGRLTVIERVDSDKYGNARWKCRCDCNNECVVGSSVLLRGNVQSCGCIKREILLERNTKHGMTGTLIHKIWGSIKDRCNNPNCKAYPNYGGRGIEICAEWQNDFQAFYNYVSTLEHFGEEGYSLDRIDNNGNYEPGNLRFADRKIQTQNRRNTIKVNYCGNQITLAQAAEISGVDYNTLRHRYHAGDTGERLFRPVKK